MTEFSGFEVLRIERLTLRGGGELAARDLMSPYVWQQPGGDYGIMVRGVPKSHPYAEDTGKIWYGSSPDGLVFTVQDQPVLAPDPNGLDAGGCEDPTVILDHGRCIVYYTGVDAARSCGQMLYAEGDGPTTLFKFGIAMASSQTEGNTKEATVNRTAEGAWRLFYEFARNDASLVGLAVGAGLAGPWHEWPQPFAPRIGEWDGWHLSTGPLLTDDPDHPVMFYNGATQDAHWRIGWVVFDREYASVLARCEAPLITPPAAAPGATDIAFAASCVLPGRTGPNQTGDAAGEFWLYYSIEDRTLERAACRRKSI